jgi:hypothetical protein
MSTIYRSADSSIGITPLIVIVAIMRLPVAAACDSAVVFLEDATLRFATAAEHRSNSLVDSVYPNGLPHGDRSREPCPATHGCAVPA